jgi:NAD(P)-dependent dehydrogenase (short-subunit alcohol dehydrogenase family)
MNTNLFDLSEKVTVLFGGSGILGTQFAKALSDHGAIVISCDLKNPEIQDKRIQYIEMNAAEPKEVEKVAQQLIDEYRRIDVLINSVTAKGSDFYLPFDEVSLEGWEIGLKGNLSVPFITCQKFIKQMCKQKSGSIINISSVYGLVGNDQRIYEGSNLHEIYVNDSPDIERIYSHGVYNAAKAGLNNFTRYLAAYYGGNNIRVNCISPGGVAYPKENDTFLKKYSEKVPLGRKANADEMNGAVVYLASDASSYVTGHNLVVDGGYTCW